MVFSCTQGADAWHVSKLDSNGTRMPLASTDSVTLEGRGPAANSSITVSGLLMSRAMVQVAFGNSSAECTYCSHTLKRVHQLLVRGRRRVVFPCPLRNDR